MDKNEQTFIIIKPDAIDRGLIGKILGRFEDIGLFIERIKKHRKSELWCCQHYVNIWHQFGYLSSTYQNLSNLMITRSTIGVILLGHDAIKRVRKIVGATSALEAEPGTIRGDWGKYPGPYNLVHAADSAEAVEREIELYFNTETNW